MTPDEVATVFEPFAQFDGPASPRTGRLGVALSIGKHAIEACGGSLRAASAGPGSGSSFVIELPVAPPTSDSPCHESPEGSA
jgi:signal transduction histidine kinase